MSALVAAQLWLLGLGLWARSRDYTPGGWLALIAAGLAPTAAVAVLALQPDMGASVVSALPAPLQAAPPTAIREAVSFPPAPDLMRMAALLYAAVAALLILRLALRTRALHRLPAREVEPGVHLSQTHLPPFALGWPRPRVVVAEPLWEGLSTPERAMLLAHERSHLSRRDPETTLALLTLQAVFWVNPGLRVMVSGWRRAVEIRADRAALTDHSPRDYAALFARLARSSAPLPVPTACAKGDMTMRLKTILDDTAAARRMPVAALLLGGVMSLGTIAAAAERAEPVPIKRVPPYMPKTCPGLTFDKGFDLEIMADSMTHDEADGSYRGQGNVQANVGQVDLRFDVDADGVPQNIAVTSANNDCFRKPSIGSVRQWRFPAGAPARGVESRIRFVLTFEDGEDIEQRLESFTGG